MLVVGCVAVVAGCGCWVGDCGGWGGYGGLLSLWGVAAVIFLLAAAFRAMFRAMPFSFLSLEAFSAGNALLFSGIRRIRYRRGPPGVRNMRAVLKKASYGTRRIFRGTRCAKQAPTVRKRYSVPETPFSGTGHVCQHPKISGNRYCNRMGRRNVGFPKKISGVLDY